MNNKRIICINNLIALCHIIDNFEEFEKKLIKAISPKYNRDFIFQLWDISEGRKKIGARKAKKFYEENKEVIDTINKYTNLTIFINENYGWYGESNGNLQFFCKYIKNNKEKTNHILSILLKLKELGFSKLTFDEQLNVNNETYTMHPTFERNSTITYVANPIVTPSYTDQICYQSSNSNYKMELNTIHNRISINCKK